MNMQIALRHRSHAPSWSFGHPGWWCAGIVVLTLLLLGLWPSPPAESDSTEARVQPLVHFQDARHDWLMVVDPATHELVVYDAKNGRPLQRLGAGDGWFGVTSISRKGSLLFVTGDRQHSVRVLTLPQLQTVALDAR